MQDTNLLPQKVGQSEAAEEVLRQHYYIARSTKRTAKQQLDREPSPQKHMAGNSRLSRLEDIQVQAAALMRLNAIWGLEKRDKQVDIFKARVTELEVAEGGVIYDVLPETQRVSSEQTSDLEMMISLFMRQP